MKVYVYGDFAEAYRAPIPPDGEKFTVEGIVNGALRGRIVTGMDNSTLALRHPRWMDAFTEIRRAAGKADLMDYSKGILFVGGPEHGKRRVMRDRYGDFKVAHGGYVPNGDGWRITPDGPERVSYSEPTFTTTVYTREKVGIERRSLEIMRHESLSRETAAQAALDIVFYEAGGRV